MNKTTEVFESENSNYSSTSVERALKLAENTLRDIIRVYKFEGGTPVTALAAIREVLAESKPAPDGRIPKTVFTIEDIGKAAEMGRKAGMIDALAEPVKQEPVAVISESAIGLVKLHANGVSLPFGTQLYAAPVSAKREWVDMTKAEQLYLLASHIDKLTGDVMGLSLIDAVVAKFKEKNK